MKNIIETLPQIFIDIFMGYGIYSVVFVILNTLLKRRERLIKFDEAASRVVILSGILYTFCLIGLLILLPNDNPLGRYGWGPWVQPAIWILITQLLWFRTLRHQRIIRVIFSVFLIGSFEAFVIFVTSFHRDYIPSGWTTTTTTYDMLLGLTLKTLIFCLISYLFLYLSDKLKRLKIKEI